MMAHHNTLADSDAVIVAYGRSPIGRAGKGSLIETVRLAQRAEHPVGHRPQVAPVGLESLRQPVMFVHRSHSLDAFRHSIDERNPSDVTRRSG